MHEKQQKELLIKRILKYLPDAPHDAAQRLLQETVANLEHILAAQSDKHAKQEAAERVSQHADEMRRESQLEGAFVHSCRAVINNRRLAPCESNRAMLESLLNPLEEPSTKLYVALAEQFPDRFTWETPKAPPTTKEDQRAAFGAFVRDNNLSGCEGQLSVVQARRGHREFRTHFKSGRSRLFGKGCFTAQQMATHRGFASRTAG